jgi:hypothetical protein
MNADKGTIQTEDRFRQRRKAAADKRRKTPLRQKTDQRPDQMSGGPDPGAPDDL